LKSYLYGTYPFTSNRSFHNFPNLLQKSFRQKHRHLGATNGIEGTEVPASAARSDSKSREFLDEPAEGRTAVGRLVHIIKRM
jgi:hypothetical protein